MLLNKVGLIQGENFFNIHPKQAINVLKLMAIEDVTPTVQCKAQNVDLDASHQLINLKN